MAEGGQKLLRQLSRKKLIKGLFVEEANLGLEGHWDGFCPDLVEKITT